MVCISTETCQTIVLSPSYKTPAKSATSVNSILTFKIPADRILGGLVKQVLSVSVQFQYVKQMFFKLYSWFVI